jgi:DNA replication protein DnaC
LLVDREAVERESKRLISRLKYANLRQNAVVEDLDTKAARGLDKALFAKLASGEWIARHQDLLITGKTGTGKSWLACALARGDGRYPRLLKSISRVELLVLDDWGLAPLTSQQGRDLLDIVDDRHGRGSTIVTSQVPVQHWYELIADPTIADAVLDRLVHTAHRLALDGPSMRNPNAARAEVTPPEIAVANTKSAKGAMK